MTEIGRRTAILVGTGAFAISVLLGIFYGGDLVMVSIRGLAAGLLFGAGGLLVGNLADGYVNEAAKREFARRTLERELRRELQREMKKKAEEEVEEEESAAVEE